MSYIVINMDIVFICRCLIFASPFILYIIWRIIRAPFEAKVEKIPGPKAWPIIGNALDMLMTPVEMFTVFYIIVDTWGPVFRFWVLGHPQVVIQRAKDAERVLSGMTHHHKSDNYRFLHDWMGTGLITSKDEKWKRHRKILNPAFSYNILGEFMPIFNKNALRLLRVLAADQNSTAKQGVEIFHYTSLLAIDIVCESSMGKELNALNNENSSYVNANRSMAELLVERYFSAWLRPDLIFKFSSTKRKMDKCIKELNDLSDQVINERREYLKSVRKEEENTDDFSQEKVKRRTMAFIDVLLNIEAEGSQEMTQKDIRDHVASFLFAGHDTVSTSMGWLLFMLGNYPEHQDRIVEELVEVFGDSGRAPDLNDIANLKCLERCIKEAMRIYPSAPFVERSIEQDCPLDWNNLVIPGGSTMSLNVFMLHREEEYWPEPEKFDPDRFLPENSVGRHAYSFIPFSAGPRNCIGQKYAMVEEKAVISTLLRRFRVEAAYTRDDVVLQMGMILRPVGGLHVRFFERDSHPYLRVNENE